GNRPGRNVGLFRSARSPLLFGSPGHVVAAKFPVYVGECVRLPEISERQNPLLGLLGSCVIGRLVGELDVQHVEDEALRGMTTALAGGGAVLLGEVLAERGFSSRAVFSKEARADFARSVTDDPARVALPLAVGVDFFRFEPESWPC